MLADVPGEERRPTAGVLGLPRSEVRAHATHDDSRPTEIERILVGGEELPLGAHLTTSRVGFVHDGIYVGDGKVVHCGAASGLLLRGPVEEISLSSFSRGRPVSVRRAGPAKFYPPEIIARARSCVGEDTYRPLTNNCEHFAEWCLHGRPPGGIRRRWNMGWTLDHATALGDRQRIL